MRLKSPRARSQDWDTPWKEVLHLCFRDFLRYCFPEIATQIDWTKEYTFLDKELKRVSRDFVVGHQIADMLIKVWMRPETGTTESEEVWILFHLELQSTRSSDFAKRMCRYYVRIWERYDKPVVSIAILSDQHPNWRPSQYQQVQCKCRLMLEYLVVKILDYRDQRAALEASSNLFAPVILSQLIAIETEENSKERLHQRIALSQRLYARGLFSEFQISRMMNIFDFMLPLDALLMLEYEDAIQEIEEKHSMTYTDRIEQRGIDKGWYAGLEAGRREQAEARWQEGLQEGLQEGRQEGVALFKQFLESQFGKLETKYLKEIQAASPELLSEWVKKFSTAETLDQIFSETVDVI